MFGYIRPLVGEMKVRENEMFRAVYCGLCRSMGKHTGCTSRMTLSYDFVFLAIFRAALTDTVFIPEAHRCAVHPLKKRAMAQDNDVLRYCARAAALLTHAKLQDDLRDEHGVHLLAAHTLRPAASGMRRRVRDLDALESCITDHLCRLSDLERAQCDSIDETAACFGALLGDICAWELDGLPARIAREAGEATGRFIYITDAADDAPDDAAKGRYNPLLRRYGENIFELRPVYDRTESASPGGEKLRLKADIAESIYTAALCSLTRLEGAVSLMDFTHTQPETEGILKNIAFLGMPAELRRVLALTPRKDAPRGERT